MPSISRIRFTNVVYDNGHKRYIDTTFRFDGYNGILLLENGAGKTVFVQTLIQAVLPRKTVAQRKIQETLQLNNAIAHIAVEWILEDQPRRYALTAVSLFMNSREQLASQEFALEYTPSSPVRLDTLPFVRREKGKARPATKEEMASYFRGVAEHAMAARFFSENDTLTAYGQYLEEHFKIIPSEWNKIAAINETEGGVEGYFENCRTTSELVDRLLIPTVEEGCLAASGSQTGNGFAELFESQRDHVKQQLRLEKRIAEMQGVLEQLEAYTAVQKTCFDAKESLRALNSRLRTYYGRICQDETARHDEEGALKEEQAALSARQAETERLLAACDVVEAREDCDAARTASDGAEQHFQQAERERLANLREGQNLTLSRYKRDQAHTEALLADRQQALASLEADAATQQLLADLNQNSAALRGWFCQAEAKEQENLKHTAEAMEDVRQQQDRVKAEQEKQERDYHRILSDVKGGEGQIRELLRQQEKMEKELFADSVHQEAADVQRRWQRDLAQVRQEAAGYEKNQAFYKEEGRKAAAFIAPAEKEESARQQELWQLGLALSQTDMLARNLLDRLQQWPHCANIADDTASLYRRSDALCQQAGDDLVTLEARRRDLDLARRRAHRWLDIYGSQDQFLADPVLADKIDAWSSDFLYLKSGAELFRTYSKTAEGGADGLYSRYPFWAASVVTTTEELPHLLSRLEKAGRDFFQPVFVLTEVEVRRLVAGQSQPLPTRQVVPAYWQNILPEAFSSWLEALRNGASRADEAMAENDRDLTVLRPLLSDLQAFYEKQPFSQYRDRLGRQGQLQEDSERCQRRLDDARQTVEQCRQSVELYRSRLAAARQQEAKLDADLRQLGDYLELQQQHRAILDKNGQLMKEADERQHTLAGLAQEAGRLQARHEEGLRQYSRIETRCSQLKQKLYWSEVQDAEPIPDGRDYDVLAEERRRLKSRLDGANESRGRLEAQIEGARQTAAKLAADMERLRQSAELPLDEHFVYPDDGDEREAALLRERPGLVQACRQADKAWRAARSQYDQAAGRLKTEENRYQSRYEAMPALDGPVASVRAKAQELAKSLKEALATAARKQQAAQAEGRKLAALHQQLAVKNERLLFAADDVPEGLVEGLEALHTAKELAQAVTPVLEQAEGLRQEVDERRSACDNQRETFRAYCETAVADVKLRSSIVDGIRYKREYTAYLEWQDKSRARLERVISVSEEERKGHYAHLEHMINHMILHLQDVCNGLGELAAKTRIKIGETTKDIFQIQVPPWQEAAARTSIRTYLNDLTAELDQADGEEEGQETKVRAILEKKLRTQQVLRCIFGHQAIKVRCRKATSGNTFSERPFSWEESNKWSGGEMWSKNMALFLGCLNYLSEKRCHLRRAKYNTRVVIADNPFGKASSDHVLSPVFFIAKQLGFQIIALTAHQEGSFIRKYFPVVYSCRFADMANKKG
ncbi:hypothetical protein [Megasphaera sp.]|uniref:hypothetical protein n=1 Tax=Megasphaera sp. TaxID=2023260 RepID=UPI00307C878D